MIMQIITPYYLPLPLSGKGTHEVEGLSSYVSRLAYLHGATRYQFICHLSDWWSRQGEQHGPLPRQCAAVRLNGYSRDAELFVKALETATGMPDIRAGTLLSLKDVCAKNCVGSTRQHRAWCPRCYQEDRSKGGHAYDRLLWRLQSYERCSTHKLKLEILCPHCGSIQSDPSRLQQMDACIKCRCDLVGHSSTWRRATRSQLGEEDLERLVSYVAKNPGTTFGESAPWTFLRHLEEGFSHASLMRYAGDVFHTREIPLKPQLNSLLAMASYFRVPLIDIILDPSGAGGQRVMNMSWTPSRRRKKRRAIAEDRLAKYRRALERAIQDGPPYPSHKALAMQGDMLLSARPKTLRPLISELHQLRAKDAEQRRSQKRAQIDRLIRSYAETEGSSPRKPFIRRIVAEAEAPVHTVRDRVRVVCGKLG